MAELLSEGLSRTRLVVRSNPLADERLPGYLLRLSGANGYSTPARFFGGRVGKGDFVFLRTSANLSSHLGSLPSKRFEGGHGRAVQGLAARSVRARCHAPT
jgi:hypothetical protein